METIINKFDIIGITIRTTNENQKAANDIPELWNKFFSNNLLKKIPNRIDDNIYCIYTDYEKDYTKPYTVLIGCKVEQTDSMPEELVAKSFEGGKYKKFTTSKGKLSEVIIDKWMEIWNSNLQRSYTTDFELHSTKSQNPDDGEVDIFIAVD